MKKVFGFKISAFAPASLVGTWKVIEEDGFLIASGYDFYIRIDADDTVWEKIRTPYRATDWFRTGDVTKCTDSEMTIKSAVSDTETTSDYALSGSSLVITTNCVVTKYEKQ